MKKARELAAARDHWLDPALAAVLVVAAVIEVLTRRHLSGPVALNALLLGALAVSTAWRRRAPLAYAVFVMGVALVMTATLTSVVSLVVPLFFLFVPAYTVASYEPRNRALLGLAVCVGVPWVLDALTRPASVSDYVFTAAAAGASWTFGRATRARRQLNDELQRRAQRLVADRETRERLAIADERTRIARELHALVAGSVSGMVVQTEAAQQLLDHDPERADAAMAAVEDAGRQALSEMRRILGVLRRADDDAQLAPQPGVGQVHELVERARAADRDVALRVEGEAGPLRASVDLGLYRILEEALATAGSGRLDVRLVFTEPAVELDLALDGAGGSGWPTLAMRERVALCDGELEADAHRLHVRLPLALEDVLA